RGLVDQAEKHAATVMPGFTHLQVAQPVTFGHHLLAYFEMLERDRARLSDCRRRVNCLPLGAAALAGTSFPIDREKVARELGFESVSGNSLDAVSDRDFAIEFCACAALAMIHLSRLSEELDHRERGAGDRKSTRLNSSHRTISYAVFCLKKKKEEKTS